MNSQYKYYAFISYSHKDSEWAKWIQNELEHYDLLTSIKEREGIPETFRPVFRDEDELSGGDLKPLSFNAQGNKLLAFSGRGDIKIIDFISSQKLVDACRSIISNGCVNQEDQTYHCM